MTISAVLANIREDRFGVALGAAHFFVHAAQRVFGLVVIEFRYCADGPPAGSGVAVLAGDGKRTVWTASIPSLSEGQWSADHCRKQHQPQRVVSNLARNCPLTLDRTPSWVQPLLGFWARKAGEQTVRKDSSRPLLRTVQPAAVPWSCGFEANKLTVWESVCRFRDIRHILWASVCRKRQNSLRLALWKCGIWYTRRSGARPRAGTVCVCHGQTWKAPSAACSGSRRKECFRHGS